MRKVASLVVLAMLFSHVSFAGPLKDAAAKAGQTVRPSAQAESSDNTMLWVGLGLLGAGGAVALYGFTHATGAEIGTNPSGDFFNVRVKETHATGVGIAGLAIAGVGAVLLMKGQKHSRPDRRVTFGANQVTIRF